MVFKLRIAAVMNDEDAARSHGWASRKRPRRCEHVWRLALARWHRTKRTYEAAKIADYDRNNTSESAALAIECAVVLCANTPELAKGHLAFALELCNRRGYGELHTLARLLEGGSALQEPHDWQTILNKAKTSPWLDLSMTALAMEGRRLLNQNQPDKARSKFQNLLQRADHLDNQYHRAVAHEVLVKL